MVATTILANDLVTQAIDVRSSYYQHGDDPREADRTKGKQPEKFQKGTHSTSSLLRLSTTMLTLH